MYGPFEVLERLGIGGMATVHRAIERGIEGFERVVALKRLLPHLAEDEGFVRAFVREAKLASLLQHGNIVQLYELGRVGPSYFISMEYIPGRDLRVILRQARRVCGPPPVEIALALLTELLDALDYAHSQIGADGKPLGLVHRDISPSNLIVSHTGHLKVIDFGIAKATLGHLMTHTGRIKGKLSYMAPEALAGRTLDGRSDLFSASVIAHELLTATPLFAAKDDFQTIDRLQNMQPPPPSARNPSCPSELDAIVLRGLAKDPTQRWRTAAEMRAALAELAIDHYRLATNREVCDWVEEAFEMPIPSRMRLPPAAATSSGVPRPADHRRPAPAASDAADDEIMDIVWGVTGPRSPMDVVLDDVPDVSRRFARADGGNPMERDDPLASDPLERLEGDALLASLGLHVEEETTNAMGRPTFDPGADEPMADRSVVTADPRVSFRSTGPVALTSSSAVVERTPQGGLVSRTGRVNRPSRPSEWAHGTSRTSAQPVDDLLEDLMPALPRRAEPMPAVSSSTGFASAAAASEKPSLVPLLIASVAVAAAGAAIAWIVSSGDADRPAKVAAVSPAAKRAPVPPPPVVVPAAPAQPEPSLVPDPALEPNPAGGPAGVLDDQAAGDSVHERTRASDRRRPRPVRRDGGDERVARGRDERASGDAPRDERVEDGRGAGEREGQTPEADGVAAAASATATGAAGQTSKTSKSDAEGDVQPLPVPVRPPEPAHAGAPAQAHARGPIVVAPGRTRRESGTIPPVKFPRWETAPSQISAKICIDPHGAVTSAKVLSPVSSGVRATIEHALSEWRYRPIAEGSDAIAACFATTFRIQVE